MLPPLLFLPLSESSKSNRSVIFVRDDDERRAAAADSSGDAKPAPLSAAATVALLMSLLLLFGAPVCCAAASAAVAASITSAGTRTFADVDMADGAVASKISIAEDEEDGDGVAADTEPPIARGFLPAEEALLSHAVSVDEAVGAEFALMEAPTLALLDTCVRCRKRFGNEPDDAAVDNDEEALLADASDGVDTGRGDANAAGDTVGTAADEESEDDDEDSEDEENDEADAMADRVSDAVGDGEGDGETMDASSRLCSAD